MLNCYSLTQTALLKKQNQKIFIKKDLFDFSNYSRDSIFYDDTNKKVIGIMKHEYGEVIMIEFI